MSKFEKISVADGSPIKGKGQTGRPNKIGSNLIPIGLNREEAAFVVGVCPNTFDGLVQIGVLPQPLDLPFRRRIWSRKAIELAFDNLAGLNDNNSLGLSDPASESTLMKRLNNG